jgi:xylulokinase
VSGRTAAWHTATSFIVARLTGVAAIDHHQASYFAPFIDARRRAWDVRHAATLGLPELGGSLPPLRWPNEIAGTVTAAAAESTGLPEGLPVVVGTSDGPMEALALGATRPGVVAIAYGSTTTLTALGSGRPPRRPRDVWLTEGITPERPCLGAGLATTGALMAWLAGLLAPGVGASGAAAILAREAAASPPGSRSVSVLPWFAGGPAVRHDPAASGVIAGLTLAHGRGDIARAALEGIAFGVREALEALVAAGVGVEGLRASGGGTANELALQIVSDVTGFDHEVAAPPAGAAMGAARLAAEAVGLVPPSADWFVADRRIEANTSDRAAYEDAYRRYRRLADGPTTAAAS